MEIVREVLQVYGEIDKVLSRQPEVGKVTLFFSL